MGIWISEDARVFAFFLCYLSAKERHTNDVRISEHNRDAPDAFTSIMLSMSKSVNSLQSEYSYPLKQIPEELWIRTITNIEPCIEHFSQWFDKKVDQIFSGLQQPTPKELRSLITNVTGITPNSTVIDPCCGTGGLLAAAANHNTVSVTGYENNTVLQGWTTLRLSFSSPHTLILKNNILDYTQNDEIKFYDYAISNPPFGSRLATSSIPFSSETYSNFPNNAYIESILIRRSLDLLKPGGKAAFIIPNGFLSRGGYDRDLRTYLIDCDYLHAVISLPHKLFAPSTSIETTLLVLWKGKDPTWFNNVAFFDARNEFTTDGRTNFLNTSIVSEICASLTHPENNTYRHQIVSTSEVQAQNYLLEPQRYLRDTLAPISSNALSRRRNLIEEHDHAFVHAKDNYERLRNELLLDPSHKE